MHCTRGEFGKLTYLSQTLRSWRRWTHRKSTQNDSMRKRWYFTKKKENLFFQTQMDESKPLEEIRPWEHPPWYGIDQFKEKVILTHEASLEPTRREDLGKHSVHTHFTKDRNCEDCKRTKITKASCRRRIGGAVPRAENFGDLKAQITKFFVKDVNLDTIIDLPWWYKMWQLSGYNPTHVKQKLLRRPEELYEIPRADEES